MVGVGADWQAMDNLKFSASYLYVENKGDATFGYQSGVVLNNPPVINIDNFDSSKQQYFNLRGTWNYNKNWSITGGYSYMKYSHNDIATDGYQYILPYQGATPTNTSLSYLNGYDAFTNGSNNIFYLLVTYKFDAPQLPIAQLRGPEPPPPPPAAQPAPPPPHPRRRPRPAPAPQVQKITLDSKVLFDFDKAVLKPEGRAAIDSQVVGRLAPMQKLEVVLVTGHTDRLGTEAYNQKLSAAARGCGARLPREQGRRQGQDRNDRHGREAAGRAVRSEEPEAADRLPAAQPSRRRAGQGRVDCKSPSRNLAKPRVRGAFLFGAGARARQVRRRAATIAHVCDGEQRVAVDHARAGVAHHGAHALAHDGAVAMDLAVGAGRLVVAEHAAVEAAGGVGHQRRALLAVDAGRRVVVTAVDRHHRADRRQLAREARMPGRIVGPARRHLSSGRAACRCSSRARPPGATGAAASRGRCG